MCGICGKLQIDGQQTVDPELIDRMMDAIAHRGPDGHGKYTYGPVGLGHTRLAIIDLSRGAQPIANEDETVWIVFNGEIYNYQELREDLIKRGHKFRSESDTEVIIHLYEEHGFDFLNKLRGMFAFAIWDQKDRSLLVARDRVGIKPVYYHNSGKALVFASEIKALLKDPAVKCEVSPQSVDKFLTHLCLPGSDTLWKDIYKLDPGFFLFAKDGKIKIERYWDLKFDQARKWESEAEASEELYRLVKQTVRDHMISDVPVGFLLSGGLDSTVVVSCAVEETSKRCSTFTVGFDEPGFTDERPYARLAAKRFNTDHHEITISPKQFWDFLPSLIRHMEEPVCDPPAVSLHYVSQLARKHVKVLLSGEGGDEAFGGYSTYRNFLMLERIKKIARPLNGALHSMFNATGRIPRLQKLAKFAPYTNLLLAEYYYSRSSSPFSYFNQHKDSLYESGFRSVVSQDRSVAVIRDLFARVQDERMLDQMQYIDIKTSLPDDLLVKADKMTMGNSLELRVPFLDHKVLEFAGSLPPCYRVKGLSTKRLLKETFRNRIPSEIIERKKAGFPIPIERWIREDLRGNVRDILFSKKCLNRGYFKREAVEKMLTLDTPGRTMNKEIFSLLTLEMLHLEFVDR